MAKGHSQALTHQLMDVAISMKHSGGTYMVPGWDGYKMAGLLEDALAELDKLLAERDELRARVQELGTMARENRSRAVVDLEAELDKLRADARRYQWLRDRAEIDYSINGTRVLAPIPRPSANLRTTAAELDDAIDQAMSTTMPSGGAL